MLHYSARPRLGQAAPRQIIEQALEHWRWPEPPPQQAGQPDQLIHPEPEPSPTGRNWPWRCVHIAVEEALREVVALNFEGTLLPCQVFGRGMAERGRGAIVNISSMAASRPLSRAVDGGFSAESGV